jgi:quinoprotein glucose dehydrogenase
MRKFVLAASAAAFLSMLGASGHAAGARSGSKPASPALESYKSVGWTAYNGGANGDHYSPLKQINRANVARLRVAWTFDTGEKGAPETNPLVVSGALYAYTPSLKVIALDAATGKLLWKFDSGVAGSAPSRGFSYWTNGKQSRLFAGVMNYLYALDPATGKPIPSFGENGRIDLRKNLGRDYRRQDIALTTPGIVYKNLIIVGGRVPETWPAPPGNIRAYDVRTGVLRWTFHTIPHPGENGYNTWPTGAWKTAGSANNWTGMALDRERGIVYVPTGSAVPDFFGGNRLGNDLFADTLLALDASTGKRLWSFQGVHHDLWDRDFPSPPALVTVEQNGRRIDAVAQTTKQGYLYLFNRQTGKPLFPIVERPEPPSTVPGEKASPTQPFPLAPEPFARRNLTAAMLTNRTAAAHAYALAQFKNYPHGGAFLPLSVGKQTIVFPGFDGGAEWGGPAVDPKTGVIYINSNEMAWTGGLEANKPTSSAGESIYQSQCAVCHGANREGSPPTYPSLVGIGSRLSATQIKSQIRNGGGRMPAFHSLDEKQISALVDYLTDGKADGKPAGDRSERNAVASSSNRDPYHFTGYRRFVDREGYPAITPPWGTLNAIDLNTGKYLWKIPLGEFPALAETGKTNTGSENYGGPVVTAGGLLFIGATVHDNKIRAYNSSTGKLLWEATLPAAGAATPATYMVNGRQFVAISAAGSKEDKPSKEARYVAFALPKSAAP